jgi:predicted nucleic acid-binding protein
VIAYLDSSVVLRVVLGQRGSLREWKAIETGVASALLEVECLRTLDRLRLLEGIAEGEIARRREAIYRIVEALTVIEPTRPVLARAAQPFPVVLGTLDAIHLATALMWRERSDADLVMATHDATLGLAARAVGFRVIGL